MTANRPNRALHLIDIENLLGQPRPVQESVRLARIAYEHEVGLGEHDHVVVACNHGAFLEVGLAYSGVRLLARSGPDGADFALLDALEEADVVCRFDELVIGSGDGIFSEPVADLTRQGFPTTVVSRPEAISRRLLFAAGCRYLPFDPHGRPTTPAGALHLAEAA